MSNYHSLQIEFESFQKQVQREVELQIQRKEQQEWESREQLRLEKKRREDTRLVLEDREKDKRIRELEIQAKRYEPMTGGTNLFLIPPAPSDGKPRGKVSPRP